MKLFRRRILPAVLLAAVTAFVSCSQKPAPIHLNSDECAYCKMMITDSRFAAQIVTAKGKALKFDAIECMADYAVQHEQDAELGSAKMWVSDFNNPKVWISIDRAVLVKSEEIQSPMGESLLALENQSEAEKHLTKYPGEIVTWTEITTED